MKEMNIPKSVLYRHFLWYTDSVLKLAFAAALAPALAAAAGQGNSRGSEGGRFNIF